MFNSSKYKNGYLVRVWFHPKLLEGSRIGLVLKIKGKTIFLFNSGSHAELEKIRGCKIEEISPTYLFDARFSSVDVVKEKFKSRFFDTIFDSVNY